MTGTQIDIIAGTDRSRPEHAVTALLAHPGPELPAVGVDVPAAGDPPSVVDLRPRAAAPAVEWCPVELPWGDRAPDAALRVPGRGSAAVGSATAAARAAVRDHLDTTGPDGVLAVLTTGAGSDPAQAAVWGVVRSAQVVHPGRFVLVDGTPSGEQLARVVASVRDAGENRIAVRGGAVLAPRPCRQAA